MEKDLADDNGSGDGADEIGHDRGDEPDQDVRDDGIHVKASCFVGHILGRRRLFSKPFVVWRVAHARIIAKTRAVVAANPWGLKSMKIVFTL